MKVAVILKLVVLRNGPDVFGGKEIAELWVISQALELPCQNMFIIHPDRILPSMGRTYI